MLITENVDHLISQSRVGEWNEREQLRNQQKHEIEELITRIIKKKNISPLILGQNIKDKLLLYVEKIIDAKNKDIKKDLYINKNGKKVYLTLTEWQEMENYKSTLIVETLLENKPLTHKASINKYDAKEISTEIDNCIKNTKILKQLGEVIKIDRIILKELAALLINKKSELFRYVLERNLSSKLVASLEDALTIDYYRKINLTRAKILDLLTHEAISKDVNYILIISSILQLLKTLSNTEFNKCEKPLSVILKNILIEKKKNVVELRTFLLNKLSCYKRVIGDEVLEILRKTKSIEQFTYNKKKERVIMIKIVIPSILINLAIEIPNLILNKGSRDIPELNYGDIDVDITARKSFKYESFSNGQMSEKRHGELDKQFSCGYELNYENIIDMLANVDKIIKMGLDVAKNKQSLKYLSDFYKINFINLKQSLDNKTFTTLLQNAIAFEDIQKSPVFTSSAETQSNLFMDMKEYVKRIHNEISGKKFIYYDIMLNICILINFKSFYFNYFADFRGRIYPLPTFSYISPYVRNYINFAYDEDLNFKNYNALYATDIKKYGTTLLLEQLKSNFTVYQKKIEKLYKVDKKITNDDIYKYNYKISTLYTIKKLLCDLQGIHFNKKNLSFTSFYSLDSSSSGTQILAILLRDKHLAEGCSLTKNDTNIENEDIYNTISKSIVKEFDEVIIPLYTGLIEMLPQLDLSTTTELMEKNAKNSYFRSLLNQINHLDLPLEVIAPFIKNLAESFSYILSEKDDQYLTNYLNVYFSANEAKILKKHSMNYSAGTLYTMLCKLHTKIYITKMKPMAQNLFVNIMRGFYVMRLILMMHKLKDIINSYKRFGVPKKITKKPCMTALYGATSHGQQTQIMEVLIKMAQNEGQVVTHVTFKEMLRYSLYLTKIINALLNSLYPQALEFVRIIQRSCKKANFDVFKIKSVSSTFEYIPYIMKSVVKKKLVKRAYRVNYRTTNINFKELANAFPANYIQHHDSILVYFFMQNILTLKLNHRNMSVWTIHDRFGIHPFYSFLLKDILLQSYKDLYNHNSFENHFKNNPKILNLRIKKGLPNYLSVDDINHPLFVKP
jgi:hypothetical protein